jgi:hypothetical protein
LPDKDAGGELAPKQESRKAALANDKRKQISAAQRNSAHGYDLGLSADGIR